jgi:hypothetical protein
MTVKTLIAVTKTTRRKTTMHSSISFILSYLNLNRNQKKDFSNPYPARLDFSTLILTLTLTLALTQTLRLTPTLTLNLSLNLS